MSEESSIEDRVRHRVAEIISSQGVGRNIVHLEIMYLMPTDFVKQYEMLFLESLGETGLGEGVGRKLQATAELGKDTRAVSRGGLGKRWKKFGFNIRNDEAWELKLRVDRRLRQIARDIDALFKAQEEGLKGKVLPGYKSTPTGVPPRCGECGRIK